MRMHARAIVRTALVVPLLAGIAACGADEDAGAPTGSATPPSTAPTTAPDAPMDPSGAWILVAGPVAPIAGRDVTVTIDAGEIGGRAACNSYGGEVAWDADGTLDVAALARTEMACEPVAVMELEQALLAALTTADRFAVDGDTLTLTSDGDAWTFTRQPPVPTAELTGTTWQLDGYLTGDAVSNEPGMDAATLTLHADGTLSGSTNCRRLTGTWVEAGGEIQLSELSAHGECDAAAADLDDRIVEVLGDGFTATVDGRRLTLTSRGGVGLTFVAG